MKMKEMDIEKSMLNMSNVSKRMLYDLIGELYNREKAILSKLTPEIVLYIQRDGKNAEIFFCEESTKVRKSLQQVFDELAAEEFIFTDRGCIVNIIHIMQVKDGEAVMKNGLHLPISRSHLQEVKDKINSYWGEHLG